MRRAGTLPTLSGLVALVLSFGVPTAMAQTAPGFTNIEVWTPGITKQRGFDKLFPAPPQPMRSLGGAAPFATAGVVVSPSDAPNGKKSDFQVGLAHGLETLQFVNVIGNREADPACNGSGTSFDAPVAADAESDLHPIEAALRCALALHPDGRWQSSHLIANDDEYVSVIQLLMSDGQMVPVYASVSDWAEEASD